METITAPEAVTEQGITDAVKALTVQSHPVAYVADGITVYRAAHDLWRVRFLGAAAPFTYARAGFAASAAAVKAVELGRCVPSRYVNRGHAPRGTSVVLVTTDGRMVAGTMVFWGSSEVRVTEDGTGQLWELPSMAITGVYRVQ